MAWTVDPAFGCGCDLAVVDGVARWHLAARRAGCDLELRDVDPGLASVFDLVGLGALVASVDCPRRPPTPPAPLIPPAHIVDSATMDVAPPTQNRWWTVL
ncbi:MAG TPA: hypothetical protein VGJ03_15495 [Acidimicrobiales bacterium]